MHHALFAVGVAVAVVALGGCGLSPEPVVALNPASVPIVEIGFEGQTDTFPYPGGIVPVLVRASVSEPSGRTRRWSADSSTLETLKADAVGYRPPGPRARFAFALRDRMLNAAASGGTASPPGVAIAVGPNGGSLIVDRTRMADRVWVQISVVFEDVVDGRPARIDATYGFWVYRE
jgi:hypothetical protein